MTAGFGPSSKVSAILRGEEVCRSVGPNNCDDGATAPQAAIPAAAAAALLDRIVGKKINFSPSRHSRMAGVVMPYAR